MRFTEFLLQEVADVMIGIHVYNPDDEQNMDFDVFAWPHPDNTISDQSRQLDKALPDDDIKAHVNFYKKLQSKSKRQTIAGDTVYGPFNSVDELLK